MIVMMYIRIKILRKGDKGDKGESLREYDMGVGDMGVRVRVSCSAILKRDGCPSYCEMPKDKSRKTCIVKSRRRKKWGTSSVPLGPNDPLPLKRKFHKNDKY